MLNWHGAVKALHDGNMVHTMVRDVYGGMGVSYT